MSRNIQIHTWTNEWITSLCGTIITSRTFLFTCSTVCQIVFTVSSSFTRYTTVIRCTKRTIETCRTRCTVVWGSCAWNNTSSASWTPNWFLACRTVFCYRTWADSEIGYSFFVTPESSWASEAIR